MGSKDWIAHLKGSQLLADALPSMGVLAKNAGRDLKADLLTIVSGVLAPGQFIVAGLMQQ